MKYFEKNVMHGADYIVLHRHLTKASAVAANNLFFQEAIDDIEREKAFAEVRESFEPIDCDDIEKLIKIILEKL